MQSYFTCSRSFECLIWVKIRSKTWSQTALKISRWVACALLNEDICNNFSIPPLALTQDLGALKCRGCQLQHINPQVYNLLKHLSHLDLGNNQVNIYFHLLSPHQARERGLPPCWLLGMTNDSNLLSLVLATSLLDPNSYKSQLKYLDKDEFADLKSLKQIHLDGNQLSVVIDNLFSRQKLLQYLGMLFACSLKQEFAIYIQHNIISPLAFHLHVNAFML